MLRAVEHNKNELGIDVLALRSTMKLSLVFMECQAALLLTSAFPTLSQ